MGWSAYKAGFVDGVDEAELLRWLTYLLFMPIIVVPCAAVCAALKAFTKTPMSLVEMLDAQGAKLVLAVDPDAEAAALRALRQAGVEVKVH